MRAERRLLAFQDPDVALAVVARWAGAVGRSADRRGPVRRALHPEIRGTSKSSSITLIRRLVDAADVHVVLAMRDDFLFECHGFRELEPVVPGDHAAARAAGRAVSPAAGESPAGQPVHGYAIEGELLVDEMVGEVEADTRRTTSAGVRDVEAMGAAGIVSGGC